MIQCPHPEPPPSADTKRFLAAFHTLGDSDYWKHIGLIRVLQLFGKLDEVTDMIEQYNTYIHQPHEEIVLLPFFPGEFSASDEQTFNDQINPKENDNGE